jgi:hypothetical protein
MSVRIKRVFWGFGILGGAFVWACFTEKHPAISIGIASGIGLAFLLIISWMID